MPSHGLIAGSVSTRINKPQTAYVIDTANGGDIALEKAPLDRGTRASSHATSYLARIESSAILVSTAESVAFCRFPYFSRLAQVFLGIARTRMSGPPQEAFGPAHDAGAVGIPRFSFARRETMLYWAVVFLIIALVAAVLGFTGIYAAAAGIAKIIFLVFLVLFIVSLLTGGFGRRSLP